MQNLAQSTYKGIKPIHAILFIAAVLRVPYVFMTSYTHDELSALGRIHVNSFFDLFSPTGLTDAHPPLVQVFLFFYKGIFGDAEWIIKLPFCMVSILAIWYVYKIGAKFYNETAALLTCLIMAVSQLFIFHSVTARPYAPALFFTVAFVYHLLNCFVAQNHTRKQAVLYIVFAWLAFATHHIATLTIFLIILFGVLVIQKRDWLRYIKLNLVLLLVSLPLLYVIKFQLQFKGIGSWLGAPDKNYILDFFQYLFHFNWVYIGAILVITGYAIVNATRSGFKLKMPYAIIFSIVFLTVYLVLFTYSVYVAPMIQFSLLQFALPFFLLRIFGLYHQFNANTVLRIGLVFLFLGVFSLMVTRRNHEFLMDFPYRATAEFCMPVVKENPNQKVLLITGDRIEFLNRYMQEGNNFSILSIANKEKPYDEIINCINAFAPDKVIAANCDFTSFSLIHAYFPYCQKYKEGFSNNFFLLTQTKVHESKKPFVSQVSLSKESIVQLDSVNEYCVLVDTPLAKLGLENKYQFEFSAIVKSAQKNPMVLVMEFYENGKQVVWHGSEMYIRPDAEKFNYTYATFDFHYDLKKHDENKIRVKFYLWNARHEKSVITNMQLDFKEPNYTYFGAVEGF